MNDKLVRYLETVRRDHQNCRNWRVYESCKRQISILAAGSWTEYEAAIRELVKILRL